MNKIVFFNARGVIYSRDKNGHVDRVKETRYATGVTKDTPDLTGRVFRQCTQLLACDYVTVVTRPLM